jgi:hypothetical protein
MNWRLPVCVLIAAAAALRAAAHDLTITDTVALFKTDETWQIDMVVDLDALALGEPNAADSEALAARLRAMPAGERGRLIADLIELFRRRVRVRFDGQEVTPLVSFPEYGTPLADEALLPTVLGMTARLSGRLPPGAREFTFWASRGFPAVRLTLVDVRAGRMVRQVLEPGEESTPFAFAHPTEEATPSTNPSSEAATDRTDEAAYSRGVEHVAPAWLVVGAVYLKLGFEHILPKGLDHILFVVGLFLLGSRWRPLLWQVTAFTIAHSVTLALSIYGIVALSPRIVEPLIAASIAYVAIENIITSRLHWWRPVVVFVFGLLHGLGFAGVLTELGLPRNEFVPALVAFNVGVEAGQLAVIALAFLAVGWFRNQKWYRRAIVIPVSVAIALVGTYWAVERVVG